MDHLVPNLFLSCIMMPLLSHCLLCPPVPTPTNRTEFSCSSPSLNKFPTGFPQGTRIVSVEFTNISSIGKDDLQGLPKLQELHLSNNQLRTLPEGLFRNLPQLHTLDLTGNLLEDLPLAIFDPSRALKHLSLKQNQLEILNPLWFHSVGQMESLDLSNNRLKEVPLSCFDKLERLQNLDLSQNFLHVLSPPMLLGMPRLERLNLEGNQLQSIHNKTFHAVHNLEFLFLQNNSLAKLPGGLFEPLGHLQMLDLSHNKLTTLAPAVPGGVMGMRLDLSENPWVCGCHIQPLVNWVKRYNVSLYSERETLCALPKSLKGRVVTSLGQTPWCNIQESSK